MILWEHPVVHVSRTLNKADHNHLVMEWVLLSLVGYEIFPLLPILSRIYLDYWSCCIWMVDSFKEPNSKLLRWILQLSEFQFHAQYKPGKKHQNNNRKHLFVSIYASFSLNTVNPSQCLIKLQKRSRNEITLVNDVTPKSSPSRY